MVNCVGGGGCVDGGACADKNTGASRGEPNGGLRLDEGGDEEARIRVLIVVAVFNKKAGERKKERIGDHKFRIPDKI